MSEQKALKLFHAITEIRDEFIEEAFPGEVRDREASAKETSARKRETESSLSKKKKKLRTPAAAAACLCLLTAGICWFLIRTNSPESISAKGSVTISEDGGVIIPPVNVDLSAGRAASMIAFFIYQGRCYHQYEWHLSGCPGLVGPYLGTATGLIDEWTPRDGYVELAGSVSGDFYAANGYDPAFMLCMKEEDGTVSTYICNNGISLQNGRELYEERLHLTERYQAVLYESRSSWYHEEKDIHTLADPRSETLTAFLDALNQAEFLPDESICFQGGERRLYQFSADCELWHIYFQMEDGTCIQLRLHEGGYVRFEGILSVCVQIPRDCFEEFCRLLAASGG